MNQKESIDGDCLTGAGRVLTGSQQFTVCGKNTEPKLSPEVFFLLLWNLNVKTIQVRQINCKKSNNLIYFYRFTVLSVIYF